MNLKPLDLALTPYLKDAPWNQIGPIYINIFPVVVGITYLLTSEISFSLWFFYLFIKSERIIAYYLGLAPNSLPNLTGSTMGAKTFDGYQQVGCYLAYVAIILWTGREHFKFIARRAFGRAKPSPSESEEALPYPLAFWGFVFSFALIIGWSIAAGIRWDVALVLWGLYIVIAIALTRIVVEGGLLFVQQGWTSLGALAQLVNSGPGTWLPPSSLVPAAFLQGSLMTDLRAFIMPSFVQGFKLAHDRKIHARRLLALITVTTLITLGVSEWMNVRLGYLNSGLTLDSWFAREGAKVPANVAGALIKGTPDVSWANWLWMGIGMAATYGMMLARSRFLWFPLHPIGFLLCLTYPMYRLWFSIFVGWLCKVLINRFGGTETYRRLAPGFLGMVLGDVTMMLFWLVIDAWQGHHNHYLMPS